jgi:eukaryotic-like serine/threonine-protein kinase
MQSWTPNTPLQNGQYIIQKVIGGGGFGETYLAEDTEENRLVVIKTLNREQRQKPDFAERQKRFRKEALDLSKCYHPHIVQVYDNFPEDGLWAIVMEHIDGDDLAAYVENYTTENGYLSETEALHYIDQIGQALECVHERKLLHRDVKPNNILLRRESKEAVLIDFGLAREFQPGKIRSMTAMITEGYAPIEQYERRGDFGYYTDVYALAATLYSLLTNRVPIPANYRAEYNVELSPPQKYNQNISDKINTAILKGMELEPVNRTQTVREFRELLGLVVKPTPKFQSFTENLENVILDMIAIPGGKFLMGSPEGEGDDDEKPQHEVTIPPFYMGKYPVTQAQWEKVASLPKVELDLKSQPSYFKGENLPVEQVSSWSDVQEFCARLSKATGKLYRLPSEAEWEYACRAKTTTPYYFGDQITTDLVNYGRNEKYGQTTEVGKFPPNAFGLYDMHGNVCEFCEDNWHENYINAPIDGSVWINQSKEERVVMRGGSWIHNPGCCRSAYRLNLIGCCYDGYIGFRVVCAGAART